MLNAFDDPWIPVHRTGIVQLASLGDALAHGHTIDGLAPDLHPLARACLHRFLDSAAAYGLQALAGTRDGPDELDEYGDTGIYPNVALERIAALRDRFELAHPTTPFLQVWYYPVPSEPVVRRDRLGKAVLAAGFLPVGQLDVHVPGDTSSLIGTRAGADHLSDAEIALALVVWWFSAKWSVRSALPGLFKAIAGAPTADGVSSTELHWIGSTLGLTTAAGVLETWTEPAPEQTPAWLDQDATVPLRALTASPDSLWRTTYTPNRPWIAWGDGNDQAGAGAAVAWGIGATGSVPALGDAKLSATRTRTGLSDREKAAAKVVHDHSPYRLHYDVAATKTAGGKKGAANAGAVAVVQVDTTRRVTYTNRSHSLLSTHAALTWYGNGLADRLAAWGTDRVAAPSHRNPAWQLGVFMERCDAKGGTRFQTTWVDLDSSVLTVSGPQRDATMVVLNFLATIKSEAGLALRRVSDDPAAAEVAQGQLLARLDEVVLDVLHRAADSAGALVDTNVCRAALNVAKTALDAAFAPYATPDRIAEIATARGRFTSRLDAALPRTLADPGPSDVDTGACPVDGTGTEAV